MTAAWLVEATLFALTAAITAVLVNLGTSQRDRARVVAQYRSRAFDAVAGFSLFTLLWTGFDVLKVVDAEVTKRAFSGPMVSAIAMLVWDVGGLGWLLVFTHHLLARTTSQLASEFNSALRFAFRDMGVREVADAIFREWGTPLGLETHPFAGFPLSACAVLAPSTGYVDDVSLPRLRKWLLSLEGTLGSSRAIMSLGLETFVSQGLQIAAVSELDASRASGSLRAIRWRTGTIYSFDSVLSDLMEGAQAAAREARPASFSAYLEILSNAFHALFDVREHSLRSRHR